MGLQTTIGKDYNFLYTDFVDAYWAISGTGIGSLEDGTLGVRYRLTAYPSREAKYKMSNKEVVSQLSIGGSEHYQYDCALYEFVDQVPFETIFSDGIALSDMDSLKTAIYNYIKTSHSDMNFTDVFEEGQVAEEEE